jgi:HSP20 family protein
VGANRVHAQIVCYRPDGTEASGGARRGTVFTDMSRRDADKLQEEIEELFADLWQVPRFSGLRHGFRPNVDCFHTDDPHALTVVVELPGVEAESLHVVAGERVLAIAGERKRPQMPGRIYQQMEIEYGSFQRQVRLMEDVDPNGAHASFEQGVLTIVLPVVEQPMPAGRYRITVERLT